MLRKVATMCAILLSVCGPAIAQEALSTDRNPFSPGAMEIRGTETRTAVLEKFVFGKEYVLKPIEQRVSLLEQRLVPYNHNADQDLGRRIDHLWTILSAANGALPTPTPFMHPSAAPSPNPSPSPSPMAVNHGGGPSLAPTPRAGSGGAHGCAPSPAPVEGGSASGGFPKLGGGSGPAPPPASLRIASPSRISAPAGAPSDADSFFRDLKVAKEHLKNSDACIEMTKYQRAIDECTKAAEIMQRWQQFPGQWDEQLADFECDVRIKKGDAYMRVKQYREAIEEYANARPSHYLTTSPQQIQVRLGEACFQLGDYTKAAAAYSQGLEGMNGQLAYGSRVSDAQTADKFFRSGEPEKAAKLFHKALLASMRPEGPLSKLRNFRIPTIGSTYAYSSGDPADLQEQVRSLQNDFGWLEAGQMSAAMRH